MGERVLCPSGPGPGLDMKSSEEGEAFSSERVREQDGYLKGAAGFPVLKRGLTDVRE